MLNMYSKTPHLSLCGIHLKRAYNLASIFLIGIRPEPSSRSAKWRKTQNAKTKNQGITILLKCTETES
jgi:hypothetical protein